MLYFSVKGITLNAELLIVFEWSSTAHCTCMFTCSFTVNETSQSTCSDIIKQNGKGCKVTTVRGKYIKLNVSK